MSLRADPSSIAPHRALVFEIAGSVDQFYKAAAKVPGLEFVTEEDYSFDPDDDFSMLDDGLPTEDLLVQGKRYLAMPTGGALEDMLKLYRDWRRGKSMPRGFTPWRDVFLQLKTLRPWGPQDRITDDAIAVWESELADAGVAEVSIEAELFFHRTADSREEAIEELTEATEALGGEIITTAEIPQILYHAALVKLPTAAVQQLMRRDPVSLVLADQVMFLRPQSSIRANTVEPQAPTAREVPVQAAPLEEYPIAALLDGFPLQNHALLRNRLSIDDPDEIEPQALVAQRHHGTAMASLILHGDLNADGLSLSRPLHVYPILYARLPGADEETSPTALLVDTIYRAIVRMKEPDTPGGPTAPNVFIVNLSLGDRRRTFAGPLSPLGRLLDYLALKYGILFLVSAGNVTQDVTLHGFNTIGELEAADAQALARAFLEHIRAQQANRTLLAPAEALNPLTIGAAHDDSVPAGFPYNGTHGTFLEPGYPNVSSALGLGHRRVVKPDLILPGGKERMRVTSTPPVTLAFPRVPHGFGLRVAAPDPGGQARLDRRALMCGTSVATAIATRTAHLIFDSMMDEEGGSNLSGVEPEYWPVVVKAMMVHAARWSPAATVISDVFGPVGGHKHAERADNVSRLMGYGTPQIERVTDCTPSQATLVGYGAVSPTVAHEYRIPLPECLEAVTDPRRIVVTLAWLSPVEPKFQDYRRAQLLVDVPGHQEIIGVSRSTGHQPSDFASKRGSVIHQIYEGDDAVAFLEDEGNLVLRVWCREKPSHAKLAQTVRYGLAVTIEAGTALPVYQQIDVRLREAVEI